VLAVNGGSATYLEWIGASTRVDRGAE
jgi:hypothetical protein